MAEKEPRTILLVEDDAVVAMGEARALEKGGYAVRIAHSGEDAVTLAEADPSIDLVLMDIDLGRGMDGTGTAEAILAMRDIPVVFLSSHTEPEIVERSGRIASYGYVDKAGGETLLLASIRMAFRLHEAHLREKEIRKTLILQSLVLEQIQDRVTITDLQGTITYVNEADARSLGRSREELIGSSVIVFGDDPLRGATQREIIDTTLREGKWRGEVVNFAADGTEVFFDSRTTLVRDPDGTPIAMCGVSTDMTERKRIESSLEEALKEKEILLREIQHRTKNSMALIASLISLEMDRRDDASVRRALEDIHGRVAVLANLYGLLYEGGSSDVRLDRYMRGICDSVSSAFSAAGTVRLEMSFDETVMDPRCASAFGLILNELLTNVYKHAFADGRSGTLRVDLARSEGKVELAVSDNGIDLPDGFAPERSGGFGLRLVGMLVKQLGGRLNCHGGEWTVFRVVVPL